MAKNDVDPRLTEWLEREVPKAERKRYGMVYTPKPITEYLMYSAIELAVQNGLVLTMEGVRWLPVLEPFAGIGLMVQDATAVCLSHGIMPCVVAYEINPKAASECQRRNPWAYVKCWDTFATPVDKQVTYELHCMQDFQRRLYYTYAAAQGNSEVMEMKRYEQYRKQFEPEK